ncbi:DNA-binding NarL/FixJ family response regulator [Kibdelosporangium banguiense]|uniref:DNA-binding NarL/FixJ family response regulator n=1 Tax=Kibdelosporangium banguiense TaxID=1365924 RepID=A0ABS4TJ08_9PSEU|nr:response regulator transcription factor [Kibdelosporangium banguiense]MBP2324408.1 DNA-binding NarL/FixJ family response regulator [Kibdelosporangium banguiense]
MQQVRVTVQTSDPMSHVGLTSYLETKREFAVVDGVGERPDVVLFSTERLSTDAMARLRQTATDFARPTVLMTGDLSDAPLLTVVECRVVAILPKKTVTSTQLVDSILAAADGNGVMPRDILGKLLRRVEVLQREVLAPNGLNASGLQPREVDVLRLIADGLATEEIAQALRYSERTVKNVIYNLTARLHLRNRAHAVAYALRAGVI